MINWQKTFSLGGLFFLLASCTCGVPLKVTAIQRSDKKLACKDIILEINEAEHYREAGGKAKGIGMGEALMPICWVTGFIDGTEATQSANERIEYLGHIYDLLDCGGKGSSQSNQTPPPPIVVPVAPQSNAAPAPIIVPPIPQPQAEVPQYIVPNSSMEPDYSTDNGKPGYYRLLNDPRDPNLHEHRDSRGKLYIHSHSHKGPHRHLEDE